MDILYGVAGEGLGHTMRSHVLLEHLARRGHRVKVAASGRSCAYLAARGHDVLEIRGLSLCYARGAVSYTRTATTLARRARRMLAHNLALCRGAIARFSPALCISDFDSLSHAFGQALQRPVISIDHQHALTRCRPDPATRSASLRLAECIVRAKLPGCHHYLVTALRSLPVRDEHAGNTTIVGPILRPEVLARTPTSGDRVLVYQTGACDRALLSSLRAIPEQRFVLYARGIARPRRQDNVDLQTFDEAGFLDDLASARAVVCNGGYTTISEAAYYGKPVLSVPLRGHGEQQHNAKSLSQAGLGQQARRASPDAIRAFLRAHSTQTDRRIEPGNARATEVLDGLLGALT